MKCGMGESVDRVVPRMKWENDAVVRQNVQAHVKRVVNRGGALDFSRPFWGRGMLPGPLH